MTTSFIILTNPIHLIQRLLKRTLMSALDYVTRIMHPALKYQYQLHRNNKTTKTGPIQAPPNEQRNKDKVNCFWSSLAALFLPTRSHCGWQYNCKLDFFYIVKIIALTDMDYITTVLLLLFTIFVVESWQPVIFNLTFYGSTCATIW